MGSDPNDDRAKDADGGESASDVPAEDNDEVEEQSKESFPASDPPSY